MIEFDRTTRDAVLMNSMYQRLLALGSKLNSRLAGGPVFTLISAFVAAVSDICEEIASLFYAYNPLTAVGSAQDQVLGFFELPRLQPTRAEQTFTFMRTVATAALTIPFGAAIQTGLRESGKTYSYKVVRLPDAVTMPIGVYFVSVTLQSTEIGLVTSLVTPQVMQVVSGVSGVQVVAGLWDASSLNPLATLGTDTMDVWLSKNAQHFSMSFRVQGRDIEGPVEFRARCFARWDEQSVGSTSGAYESWAKGYVDAATGNKPVTSARVTTNQVFVAAINTHPTSQPLVDGATYVMGVEVAVASPSQAFWALPDLQAIADHIVLEIPHTDKVWVRGPNLVVADAVGMYATCAITLRGGAAWQAEAHAVAQSFFLFDATRASNYRGLGSTIYASDIVQSLRDLSSDIEDVKVVFTLAGKVVNGDIVLAPFDQLTMVTPSTAITVVVV